MAFGYPETYGFAQDGHCGHCNGRPEHHIPSDWGVFCFACWRWIAYWGPKQEFGDGMEVTQ